MYRFVEDFLADWQSESKSTLTFLQHLTDASLAQRVDAEGWTLGKIAWHLAVAPAQLLKMAGCTVDAPGNDAPVPGSAAEIAATYARTAATLYEQVRANWTDAMLPDEISVFGQTWTRGYLLAVAIHHQTHHRGQATVLARQAGLVFPGVSGPTREEMAVLMAQFAAKE